MIMTKRTSRKTKRSSRKRTSRRNGYGRSYSGDPRWMSARYDGIDDEGNKVRKGDEVLYWPSTKRVQTGDKAKAAWRRFLSEKGDDEGTPFASNPRRKRTSRRNASFDQTYYVRLAPEDVWEKYHLPMTQEMIVHPPPGLEVSERMTLPEARQVAKLYLSDPEYPIDRLEIARFAGNYNAARNFSMLAEQWGRFKTTRGGFKVQEYQGSGFKKLSKNGNERQEYRGFAIERVDSTQLGYRVGEGMRSSPGKGRKEVRHYIYSPDDSERPIKTVATLRAAREYIDGYLGA